MNSKQWLNLKVYDEIMAQLFYTGLYVFSKFR